MIERGNQDKLGNKITISIASKDRPAVVEATLRKIHAFRLAIALSPTIPPPQNRTS